MFLMDQYNNRRLFEGNTKNFLNMSLVSVGKDTTFIIISQQMLQNFDLLRNTLDVSVANKIRPISIISIIAKEK